MPEKARPEGIPSPDGAADTADRELLESTGGRLRATDMLPETWYWTEVRYPEWRQACCP